MARNSMSPVPKAVAVVRPRIAWTMRSVSVLPSVFANMAAIAFTVS